MREFIKTCDNGKPGLFIVGVKVSPLKAAARAVDRDRRAYTESKLPPMVMPHGTNHGVLNR